MKILIAAAALLAALAAPPAAAQHSHDAATGSVAQLKLDNGKRWATDAPLRRGMGEIRRLVAAAPAAVHSGKAQPADYRKVAAGVEKETARIVAECKLEPRADAQLHLVVADLLAGAEAMKAAPDGKAGRAGLLRVAAALNAYGRHFDHPGWKPLA